MSEHSDLATFDALYRRGSAVPRSDRAKILRDIHTLTRLLDTRFRMPLVGWRFGLDSILGLAPIVGDTVSAGLSSYIMLRAWRLGARKRTLLRMSFNIVIDWFVGLAPLVGDILDVAHKANLRNARLLVQDMEQQNGREKRRFG
jgi:hypothetical protein